MTFDRGVPADANRAPIASTALFIAVLPTDASVCSITALRSAVGGDEVTRKMISAASPSPRWASASSTR